MPLSDSRRTTRRLAAGILLCAASTFASAAEGTPAGAADVDPLHGPGVVQVEGGLVLYPGAAWYPETEAATGAQGLAIVVMDLAPDGHVVASRIVASAHSPALDEQALRLVSQLHWMGARKSPSQASLYVEFTRDSHDSVQNKSCAELDADIAWLKAHDPARPPEAVGALRVVRGMVTVNSSWMPDRADREAQRPVLAALSVASRRTIVECAAHPDRRLKDVFNHQLHAASEAGEHEPPMPVQTPDPAALPRTILHTRRDDPFYAGALAVSGGSPDYPAAALAAGAQGNVEVRGELDEHGAIERVVVQRDLSGYPVLVDAALAIARGRLGDAHLEKRDPATLPAAIVMTVGFQRDDEDSVARLDCATFRVDAAGWRGERLRLPDLQSMNTVLSLRRYGEKGADARRPRNGKTWFNDKERTAQLQALDAACAAEPKKLAIDALIDALDAMPDSR